MVDSIEGAKLALRDQLSTARGHLGLREIGERAHAMAQHVMALPEVRRAATVTAYASVGREPGTSPLLEALRTADKRVLLPLWRRGNDLSWALYAGPVRLESARFGLLEPTTPDLGPDAIATADVVLLPGMAVDRAGMRMGHGGGCYDRALARVPAGTLTCVLLNSEEVLDQLPSAPHDRRVGAVATEQGVTRFLAR